MLLHRPLLVATARCWGNYSSLKGLMHATHCITHLPAIMPKAAAIQFAYLNSHTTDLKPPILEKTEAAYVAAACAVPKKSLEGTT